MTFDRLLAKSSTYGADTGTLPSHLAHVLASARELLRVNGLQQLLALGIPESELPRFRRIVELAAALHDVGKANNHFQEMIRHRRVLQGLRHEWVSGHILDGLAPTLSHCLVRPDHDLAIVRWCITGHHPAFGRANPPTNLQDGAGSSLTLLLDHPDAIEVFGWLAKEFGVDLQTPVAATLNLPDEMRGIASRCLPDVVLWESFTADERKLVAAAKACLIGGDVAGSAIPRLGADEKTRSAWIGTAINAAPTSQELHQIASERLNGAIPRSFQQEVAASPHRVTFVRAGCGSGKTVAAYLWAARHCQGRRLYFCYPTTGTATEGFRDYLYDDDTEASRFGARLYHGRADVDLDIVLGIRSGDDPQEAATRIESLDTWSTPIVSCTVDTVLGIVQNNRRGLYAWPALANAAFVFDEIHSYDSGLLGAFLRFLKEMRGAPLLLMSASVPDATLTRIREVLKRNGETLQEITGPRNLETLARYHRLMEVDPLATVRQEIGAGGKVLWVCNTVNRTMETADLLHNQRPILYHSRFRYEDRVAQHRKVIEAFKATGPALAICTQVAEMSLDLSATLLVTDLAPVPAIIQRLGRLNRRATPPKTGQPAPPTMPFIVQGVPYAAPYKNEELACAGAWLASLGAASISQAALAQAWQQLDTQKIKASMGSTWLDGGPRTTVTELREGSLGISVIMEEDVSALKSGRKQLAQVSLPMPAPKQNWQEWDRFRNVIPIAPRGTIDYDARRGARWKESHS